MNSSCVLLAEFHVNLLLDQLSVSANLQIILISYRNISKIFYQCITSGEGVMLDPFDPFKYACGFGQNTKLTVEHD